jgi:cell division protein ZapA
LDKVSVVVKLGEREFPMKVKSSDESRIRRAADQFNLNLAHYKKQFSGLDKADAIAMVAFDAIFEKLSAEERRQEILDSISQEIDALTERIPT